jgi:hypothetical protein
VNSDSLLWAVRRGKIDFMVVGSGTVAAPSNYEVSCKEGAWSWEEKGARRLGERAAWGD